MKSINQTIKQATRPILNVYFTAGYPTLDSIVPIIHALESAGADLIELGIPYSDPLADGPTIQQSSSVALANGLTLKILFDQVKEAQKTATIPIILMGYYNQMLQFGPERFLTEAAEAGVQGMIIPDLPMDEYDAKYKEIFSKLGLEISFLVTPMTSDERIQKAARLSSGFLYVVSQSAITGGSASFSDTQVAYFDRIKSMELDCPQLLGFGIHDAHTFEVASQYFEGAIIGSAFIRHLSNLQSDMPQSIHDYISSIRAKD